jgi:Uncharacterized protein conserved in bacteria (DUF2252)
VDDFDESYWLPYTNDLVRLAASVRIVADAEGLSIKVKAGCDAILEGYVQSLKEAGRPIVLAEREQKLGKLGIDSFKPPTDFWEKLNGLPVVRHALASDVRRALEKTLPDRPAKICGDRRLARRLCGPGGESNAAVCLRLVEWRGRASPVQLRKRNH